MGINGDLSLLLSFIALIAAMFISSLIGLIFGIISIVMSLILMKTEKKKHLIAITISTSAILIPIVLALTLATSLQ
ncbi:hypothetical protein MKZ07_25545 [Paenibacillus sp. FSL P4-0338]|uniref:hypothetical protein n=1 Tax=unclassified Paenibacillus TaxID=185978 RepID=UPI0003E26A2E|nr:hypothetical protein [Paenibacillus sp. FSL R7-269]ETT48136.1 hypothetical protein C162_16690 [Paenibacillus sp. FSL R7-269]